MKTLDAKTLALYLGQKCTYSLDIEWTIMGVYENDMCEVGIRGQSTTTDIANIKPILLKLESMTEEDIIACGEQPVMLPAFKVDRLFNPEQFTYLLSKGFDLFNLIDSGLALNQEQEEK